MIKHVIDNCEIHVLESIDYHFGRHKGQMDWILAGDLSTVSLDTETMGTRWLEVCREIMKTTSVERLEMLKKEKAALEKAKEAVDPQSNTLACVQFATADDRCLIVVMDSEEAHTFIDRLLLRLVVLKPVWLLHNAKFDFHQLKEHLYFNFEDQTLHDTMVCEVLIGGHANSEPVNLYAVTHRYDEVPESLKKNDTESAVSNWFDTLDTTKIEYMARDVLCLRHLAAAQKERMKAMNLMRVRKLENGLPAILVRLERQGIGFDMDKLDWFLLRAKEKQREFEEVYRCVFSETNPASSQQLLVALDRVYGIHPTSIKFDDKLGTFVRLPSTDKLALLECGLLDKRSDGRYEHVAIHALIEWKSLQKRITMAQKWKDQGRLTVRFNQLAFYDSGDDDGGARTGRMSTSPQCQNIENFMKQFIVAEEGWEISSADYKSIELCLFASYSQDPVMMPALIDGRNLHVEMARRAFQIPLEGVVDKKGRQYRIAKEVNFGFLYGMGGPSFCRRVLRATHGDIRLTDDEGWAFRNQFFQTYPNAKYYHQRQVASGALLGYVETRMGRRRCYNPDRRPALPDQARVFWDPMMGRYIKPEHNYEACYRAADWKWRNICYNHPIQGSGADGDKMATRLLVLRADPARLKMFATVHDSLDTLNRKDERDYAHALIRTCGIEGMLPVLPDIPIRMEFTVGRSWAGVPVDLLNDDNGLWYRPDIPTRTDSTGKLVPANAEAAASLAAWMDSEFQKEIEVA